MLVLGRTEWGMSGRRLSDGGGLGVAHALAEVLFEGHVTFQLPTSIRFDLRPFSCAVHPPSFLSGTSYVIFPSNFRCGALLTAYSAF